MVENGFREDLRVERLRENKNIVKQMKTELEEIRKDFREELYIPTVLVIIG